MKRLAFLSFFVFNLASLPAQDIQGIVINSATKQPVAECLVIVKGTTNNTVSDEKGKFILPSAFSKKTIVITLIGYNVAEYDLNTYKKDTFYLQPKNIQLKEIIVSAEQKTILNPGSPEIILDLDLLNDNIVILTAAGEKNNLRLIDENGKVISTLKVDKNTEMLKKDCIENLHLLSPDSAWQVFYDYEKLNTLKPHTSQTFYSVLGNCVCVCNKNYYFQTKSYRNLRTHYYYYNEDDKGRRHDLVAFQDTAKVRDFELDYNLQYFLDVRRNSKYTIYNEPVDSIIKKMELYRTQLALDWAYQKFLGQVETQMVRADSNLLLLNFTDSILYSVDRKNEVRKITDLPVLRTGNFMPQVYVDRNFNELYLISFANNELIFSKFDKSNGKEISRSKTPNIPFLPRKIIIHQGSAYFIQKNLADEQSYKLIRFRLN